MITIIHSTAAASGITRPINPCTNIELRDAPEILFYYKGGANILEFKKETVNRVTFNIPFFSTITQQQAYRLTTDKREILDELVNTLAVGSNFLVDMITDQIIVKESFMDFIPYYSIKNCIFIINNPFKPADSPPDKFQVLFLNDPSEYGLMQFLMIAIAKRDLYTPQNQRWGETGKRLLSFLIASKYNRQCNFSYENGCWTGVDIELKNRATTPLINLSKLKTTRIEELVEDIVLSPKEDPYKYPPQKDDSDILLSDVLQIGLDSFFRGKYDGIIEVKIDFMQETYKRIYIDTSVNVCFIELNPGVEMSENNLKEDFSSENIQIVTEIIEKGDQ